MDNIKEKFKKIMMALLIILLMIFLIKNFVFETFRPVDTRPQITRIEFDEMYNEIFDAHHTLEHAMFIDAMKYLLLNASDDIILYVTDYYIVFINNDHYLIEELIDHINRDVLFYNSMDNYRVSIYDSFVNGNYEKNVILALFYGMDIYIESSHVIVDYKEILLNYFNHNPIFSYVEFTDNTVTSFYLIRAINYYTVYNKKYYIKEYANYSVLNDGYRLVTYSGYTDNLLMIVRKEISIDIMGLDDRLKSSIITLVYDNFNDMNNAFAFISSDYVISIYYRLKADNHYYLYLENMLYNIITNSEFIEFHYIIHEIIEKRLIVFYQEQVIYIELDSYRIEDVVLIDIIESILKSKTAEYVIVEEFNRFIYSIIYRSRSRYLYRLKAPIISEAIATRVNNTYFLSQIYTFYNTHVIIYNNVHRHKILMLERIYIYLYNEQDVNLDEKYIINRINYALRLVEINFEHYRRLFLRYEHTQELDHHLDLSKLIVIQRYIIRYLTNEGYLYYDVLLYQSIYNNWSNNIIIFYATGIENRNITRTTQRYWLQDYFRFFGKEPFGGSTNKNQGSSGHHHMWFYLRPIENSDMKYNLSNSDSSSWNVGGHHNWLQNNVFISRIVSNEVNIFLTNANGEEKLACLLEGHLSVLINEILSQIDGEYELIVITGQHRNIDANVRRVLGDTLGITYSLMIQSSQLALNNPNQSQPNVRIRML